MDTKTDERHGVPSASALYRLANCPASWELGKQAERDGLVPPAGEDAESGNRGHKSLETGDTSGLTAEELRIYDRCMEDKAALVAEMWPDAPADQMTHMRETRLGFTDRLGRPYFSGKPDVIYLWRGEALIIDYKTGRGEVAHAKDNDQLRGLAVLVAQTYGIKRVRVAIIQPLAGAPTVADYDEAALKAADEWLHNLLIDVQRPYTKIPRTGDWCQYCPARATCPALTALTVPMTEGMQIPEGRKEAQSFRHNLKELAKSAPRAKLAEILQTRKLIRWHLEAAEDAARELLDSGEEVPGWELGEKAGNRVISDVNEAALRVAPLLAGADGGAQAALMRSCTLSAADLTKEIHHASGKKSATRYNMTEKEAKEALESALGDIVARGMKKTLQRKDETPEIETTETE